MRTTHLNFDSHLTAVRTRVDPVTNLGLRAKSRFISRTT